MLFFLAQSTKAYPRPYLKVWIRHWLLWCAKATESFWGDNWQFFFFLSLLYLFDPSRSPLHTYFYNILYSSFICRRKNNLSIKVVSFVNFNYTAVCLPFKNQSINAIPWLQARVWDWVCVEPAELNYGAVLGVLLANKRSDGVPQIVLVVESDATPTQSLANWSWTSNWPILYYANNY